MKTMPHKIYHLNGRSHENDEVIVPRNNYTKIIVHAAPQVAAQFDSLDVNCNTITSIQRVTRLTSVDCVNGADSDYDEIPKWIVHLRSLNDINFSRILLALSNISINVKKLIEILVSFVTVKIVLNIKY